jgi:uncharacterized membrane protein
MSNEEKPYKTGGYIKERAHHGAPTKDKQSPRVVEFLPHPEILESYNFIVDGSAKMILGMFENEQKHRHDWERVSLKIYSTTTIIGQILGFLIAISVFVSAAIIGVYGNTTMASMIWVFGMAIVVMAGLVWAYAKSMGQRPLFARPTMRSHFRPEKQKRENAESQESE